MIDMVKTVAVLLVLICLLLSACTTNEPVRIADVTEPSCSPEQVDQTTRNSTQVRLMTAENYLFPVHCHRQALEFVLAQRDAVTGRKRPLLFFIHGLGKHPAHAYKEQLLTRLEEQHGVKAIMMNWPSWDRDWMQVDSQARESADELLVILKVLADLKAEANDTRPYSLLTHSSGSLVVEELVQRFHAEQPEGLFDSMVLSSSVSVVESHRQWIDRVTLAKTIYSVSNNEDIALRCLESDFYSFGICNDNAPPVLGRLQAEEVEAALLSDSAIYLDFSDALKRKHRYYIYRNEIDPAIAVSSFYSAMLQGQKPALDALKEIIPGRLYRY